MSLGSTVLPFEGKTEEAGEGRFYAQFTVAGTGTSVVPALANFIRLSGSIISVTRVSAGRFKYVFDGFFVPGYSAANQSGQMGSGLGASPALDIHAQVMGANGVLGTDGTRCRVLTNNLNNEDASGVSFVEVQCFHEGATPAATDPLTGDVLSVVFTLKTERP